MSLTNGTAVSAGALLSETNQALNREVESSSSRDTQVNAQFPLLPRSNWQNQRTFLRVLIRAKRSLDIAEINVYLN